jgi:hypothetical protein
MIFAARLLCQDASLTVEWDANMENDLAGYIVYWGTAAGRYNDSKWNDKQTKCVINGLKNGVRYYFTITALDIWGNESASSREASAWAGEIQPAPQIRLENNYPNPFNPGTFIEFDLPEKQYIALVVFNTLGQKIKVLESGVLEQGHHSAYWNGLDESGLPVSSGIYYYQLKSQSRVFRKNMLLLH